MAKRRGNGEGSVYRRKDGLWVGQYKVQTSKGIKTKYIYSKTRKVVASKLAAAIAERNSGVVYDSEGLTVGDYLVEWLQSVRGTVRERTWKRSEEVVRIHLVPDLGKTRLDRLGALQVQALYRSKLDSGLSARTVRMIHTTLHKAMKQAVRWALVPRNVAEAVDPPRERGTEIRPLNEEQVMDLLRAARGEMFEALYVVAVTTGMRSGELLGLQWGDVDLEAGTLQVRRTVFNGRIEAPKTSKGRRSIRLTRASVVALRERAKDSEWVFCTGAGKPVSVHNVHNRSWKPLLKKAGLPPHTRFHDLRHTCATLLLTKGVHPKIVQEMLGHSTISITLDTYSHVLPNLQGEAVRAMDSFFETTSRGGE
ncbi:MAG: Integrase [uncultured Chloroflexia bacterium]|uniref:Integrase n=1 Tax=uncultured Chloroflexia bacterium TaxID=1672391 RepID=A0A6J4ICX7_9CHLR|nr:MAG: Integrase [uncultured Chloroflexia bacterium]